MNEAYQFLDRHVQDQIRPKNNVVFLLTLPTKIRIGRSAINLNIICNFICYFMKTPVKLFKASRFAVPTVVLQIYIVLSVLYLPISMLITLPRGYENVHSVLCCHSYI